MDVGTSVLRTYGLFEYFNITESTFIKWLSTIATSYNDNPFVRVVKKSNPTVTIM